MARFVNETRNTRYMPPPNSIVREPRLFDGTNAKEWLLQIKQYFDYNNMDEMSRVQSAPMFLTGSAHVYYYSLIRKSPKRMPLNWEDFEHLILRRFSPCTQIETINRLRRVHYNGNITEVTEQFSRVLSEGEEPPEEELISLYLSRFPRSIIKRAMERDFANWIEASEFLRYDYSDEAMRWAKWYQRAPAIYKREA